MKKLITLLYVAILILSAHTILSAQTNTDIFDRYPWLIADSIVDPASCSSETIEVYQQSIFFFLLVTDATGTATLYNQEGLFYCQNAANYDCVAAYGFDAPVETWTCDDSCDDFSGTIFFQTCNNGQLFFLIETDEGQIFDPYLSWTPTFIPVEGQRISFNYIDVDFASPCTNAEKAIEVTCVEILETPSVSANCSNNTGEIFFDQCQDISYYFIRTPEGEVLDAYLAPGLEFTERDGQSVNFDFYEATFDTPCSIADRAIIVTCVEEAEEVASSDATIFEDFPFLLDIVDTADCSGTTIEVYNQGIFSFIFVNTGSNSGQLYFEDGTFYCNTMVGYDCVSLYNFGAPTSSWSCSGSGAQGSETRSGTPTFSPTFTPYPNPSSGLLTIKMATQENKAQHLMISDAIGRIVYQKDIQADVNSIDLDISAFQNGVYYVVLQADDQKIIKKIVKQ